MVDWLKAVFCRRPREEGARVVVDDEGVRCIRPDGRTDVVSWSNLQLAGLETNDAGPFMEDVYFYLEGPGYGFYIPQASEGIQELVSRLAALPGFDEEAFAAAMSSTANARFVCWRRGRA